MIIFFSGIGGVGIGPLAEIALDAGFQVVGSDPQDSFITNQLVEKGVNISKNQDGKYLEDYHNQNHVDWFVYTSALPENHPELIKARELGIKTAKRDQMLAHIIKEKQLKLIAVAGTHGKTTTTGMLIWVMQQIGIPISYSIGTTISFGPSGKLDPSSEYFIYECDEFDRNFLSFTPYYSIITSIDYDHPDTYKTKADYLNAFSQYASQCQNVITWKDQHDELFLGIPNVEILDIDETSKLAIAGEHNRKNAYLVKHLLKRMRINQSVDTILSEFPGTSRRFEKLANNLISDYAHHPVEIKATLQMARELSDHVVIVYQPHQNIRQHEVQDQYTDQFEQAESVYWLPTYLSREDPNLPILSPTDLTKNITNKEDLKICDLDEELWDIIQTARKNGYLVICMGAGTIDKWVRDKIKADDRLSPKPLDLADHPQTHQLL